MLIPGYSFDSVTNFVAHPPKNSQNFANLLTNALAGFLHFVLTELLNRDFEKQHPMVSQQFLAYLIALNLFFIDVIGQY